MSSLYQDTDGLVKSRVKGEATLKSSGGVEPSIYAAGESGSANDNGILNYSRLQTFNEIGWDRQRGNTQGTLLASAARTSTLFTANQTNYNQDGVTLTVNITVAPNTAETLTVLLFLADPVTGQLNYGDIASFTLGTGTGIQSGLTYRLIVHPGASGTPSNTATKAVSLPVTRVWAVQIVHSGVSPWTYSVGYALN